MMINRSLLLTALLSFVVCAAPRVRADDLPSILTNFTGTLKVFQNIPCSGTINQTTAVSGGRFVLSPATGLDVGGGNKQFSLLSGTLAFTPFTASGSCGPFSGSQAYSEIEVRLTKAVTFVGTPSSPNVFSLTIPKAALQFYEAAIVNGGPENGYLSPAEDVTGTIDLTNNTFSLHVVIDTNVHFREGCFIVCAIDETDSGTLTTDASGTIMLPDTDGDGVPDILDNCRFVPNPTQAPVPTPTVTPPVNVTLPTCTNMHQFGVAAAVDVCDGGPVTVTSNAPATFVNGANPVLWTATDQKSRMASATQIVTVVDTTAPVFTFVPPGFTMNTCGAFPLGTATATDDCAGTVAITNNSPGYFLVGSTTVTWTATDASNNQSTATQVVTVIDTTPPTISCTPVEPPGVSPQGNTFQVAASDACGAPTTRLGSVVLGDNEIVKIVETGQPGVRFMGTVGNTNIRYFQVGKGEAVLVATDGSGNTASAACIK